MTGQDLVSLVGISVGIVGLLFAVTTEKKWERVVSGIFGAVGCVVALVLHIMTAVGDVGHQTQEIVDNRVTVTDSKIDALSASQSVQDEKLNHLEAMVHQIADSPGTVCVEALRNYEEFVAVITDVVQSTRRWLITRFMQRQASSESERPYFSHLNRRLLAGEFSEMQRIASVPSQQFADFIFEMLDKNRSVTALEVRLWSREKKSPNFELLVGDDVVILMQGATTEGGPPARGWVLRGREVADFFAEVYATLWAAAEDRVLKAREPLNEEDLVRIRTTLNEAVAKSNLHHGPAGSAVAGPIPRSSATSTTGSAGSKFAKDTPNDEPVTTPVPSTGKSAGDNPD